MKTKTFERELPSGYRLAKHVNAKDAKIGLIMNLVAFAVFLAVMAIAVFAAIIGDRFSNGIDTSELMLAYFIFMVLLIAYIVAHELVHGIAYKSLTGEKLSFGISWSCAFCGVPNVYTYRKTALIALCAPLVVFGVLFIALTVVFYFISPIFFLMFAAILGLHLGGCSGDIYIMYLFFVRYKGKETLMRDTGPEMSIYILENNETQTEETK